MAVSFIIKFLIRKSTDLTTSLREYVRFFNGSSTHWRHEDQVKRLWNFNTPFYEICDSECFGIVSSLGGKFCLKIRVEALIAQDFNPMFHFKCASMTVCWNDVIEVCKRSRSVVFIVEHSVRIKPHRTWSRYTLIRLRLAIRYRLNYFRQIRVLWKRP